MQSLIFKLLHPSPKCTPKTVLYKTPEPPHVLFLPIMTYLIQAIALSHTLTQVHTFQVAEPIALWHGLCHRGKPWCPKLPRNWPLRRQSGKVFACQCRRHGFDPCVGKISWSRKWWPSPVFLPEKFCGQRILAGCSPWGCKQLDVTEWLSITLHCRKALCSERALDARQQTNSVVLCMGFSVNCELTRNAHWNKRYL